MIHNNKKKTHFLSKSTAAFYITGTYIGHIVTPNNLTVKKSQKEERKILMDDIEVLSLVSMGEVKIKSIQAIHAC